MPGEVSAVRMQENGQHRRKSILREILLDYVLYMPMARALLLPTIMAIVLAKFLEVQVTDTYEGMCKLLENNLSIANTLLLYAFLFAGSIVLSEMLSFYICSTGQAGYRLANQKAYRHYLDLDPPQYTNYGKGEIQNNIQRKAQAVQDIIDVVTLNFFPTLLTIIFVSFKVVSTFGVLPMVIINVAILIYAAVTIEITNHRNEIRKQINKSSNVSSNILMDGLINHETVYVYHNQNHETERYNRALKSVEFESTRLERTKYLLNLAQRGIWCVLSVVIITIATQQPGPEKMTAGQLASFIAVASLLAKSLDNFGFMYGKYQQALINIKAVNTSEISRQMLDGQKIYSFKESIRADGVTLYYKNKMLLNNISFEVRKGEKIAIVGKNGIGKSSLLRAMVGLRPVISGAITIDGLNVKNIEEPSLRRLISYIPQDTHLFNETVIYNIKYGSPKTFDDDIYKLSRELDLHDSIMRLDQKYDTIVGEQGQALSGGERQKVIMLRALSRDSMILMMDEPTAALDKQAEAAVLEQLTKQDGLTVIAIVHNLELLPLFDRALLLDSSGIKDVNPVGKMRLFSSNSSSSDNRDDKQDGPDGDKTGDIPEEPAEEAVVDGSTF